jgi:hypothetical protein
MRIRPITKSGFVPLIFGFAILWAVTVSAQSVRFVQITDPHLFDGGAEGIENKAALAACIKKLNERTDEHADYSFAVITGDIGIENLISTGKNPNTLEPDQAKREGRLEQGAAELASILSQSKIRAWLILPGNNDLLNEEPDTHYYRVFIQKLQSMLPNLEIIDLCPEEPPSLKQNLGVYRIGSAAFIGFNNASFKNNNEPGRIAIYRNKQLDYVRQVVSRITASDIRNAYIFYHIPELDDPYIVLDSGTKRLPNGSNPYPSSSVFVDKDVHEAWKNQVVNNERVRGLFAGHYHDWRRSTYLDYHWLQTVDYLSGSLSKLYISPPLAVKRQQDKPPQARGFQEVTIDGTGGVDRRIWWFDSAEQTFDTDPSSRSNELELALYYERTSEWQQAESHFTEAAKTAPSTSVRNTALAGLGRVRDAQHPWVKAGLGWTDPLFLAPYVLRPLGVVLIALVLGIIVIAVTEGFSAMVIHPFEGAGDDELAKSLAIGFPAVRIKVTKVLSSPVQIFLPQSVQPVFAGITPRLNQLLPEQAFEIAGVKIPDLNVVLKWIVRPRFEVNGGFISSPVATFVYAEIWRRRRTWFGLRLAAVVTREIPAGPRRNIELENFIYDVYLKANATV